MESKDNNHSKNKDHAVVLNFPMKKKNITAPNGKKKISKKVVDDIINELLNEGEATLSPRSPKKSSIIKDRRRRDELNLEGSKTTQQLLEQLRESSKRLKYYIDEIKLFMR